MKEVAEAINEAFSTEYGTLVDAIVDSFQRGGHNGDQNLVEVIDDLANQAKQIAHAITAPAAPGRDAAGGTVTSLTEAVMGVTDGLVKIADAINSLAEAVAAKGV